MEWGDYLVLAFLSVVMVRHEFQISAVKEQVLLLLTWETKRRQWGEQKGRAKP